MFCGPKVLRGGVAAGGRMVLGGGVVPGDQPAGQVRAGRLRVP